VKVPKKQDILSQFDRSLINIGFTDSNFRLSKYEVAKRFNHDYFSPLA